MCKQSEGPTSGEAEPGVRLPSFAASSPSSQSGVAYLRQKGTALVRIQIKRNWETVRRPAAVVQRPGEQSLWAEPEQSLDRAWAKPEQSLSGA